MNSIGFMSQQIKASLHASERDHHLLLMLLLLGHPFTESYGGRQAAAAETRGPLPSLHHGASQLLPHLPHLTGPQCRHRFPQQSEGLSLGTWLHATDEASSSCLLLVASAACRAATEDL